MKLLKLLSKFFKINFLLIFFSLNALSEEEPVDIWKTEESTEKIVVNEEINEGEKIIIPTEDSISDSIIASETLEEEPMILVGLFDPQINNFSINMWSNTESEKILNVLKRIEKLKLSNFADDLLYRLLLTNAYSPKGMTNDEFIKIKIKWLITNDRKEDLEFLLKNNSKVSENEDVIKFLFNEYLSSGDVKNACEKSKSMHRNLENFFLEKILVYCLIYEDRKEEAELVLDLLKERGLKDIFFENKIDYLMGYKNKTSQKIIDDNLFYFYLSQITVDDFKYQPSKKTNKYIWKYLSAANLLNIADLEELENEETVRNYEDAASQNSFSKKEIFNIYKKYLFSVDQLIKASEFHKTLPTFKARALVYQSILLSDDPTKKLDKIFMLQKLFEKDKIENVYDNEIVKLINSIEKKNIPDKYLDKVEIYTSEKSKALSRVKFDNNILHRSKVVRYFLDDEYQPKKAQKELESVFKKIKKNKKYFLSIKDVILLESLKADGIELDNGPDFSDLSNDLTVPEGLKELVYNNEMGLALLKVVEIIGEDSLDNLDPETIYFLNNILNRLEIKKIRNVILAKTLPLRV